MSGEVLLKPKRARRQDAHGMRIAMTVAGRDVITPASGQRCRRRERREISVAPSRPST
jgi:hypothetical protein